MNSFWLHRDDIYEQGLSVGFKVFSAGHLLWLIGIALFGWLTGRFYRRLDERGKDTMRKACALTIIFLEYAKIIVLGLFGVNMREFVPLHLCSAAGLAALIYALWPGMKLLGQIYSYAFVTSALLAVVFPSTTMYPWWNFYCLHTFLIHGLLIAFFVWMFMSGEVIPTYKGLLQSTVFSVLFAIPIYLIDSVFHVNYMFIGTRSDVGILTALWDNIVPKYGRPVYVLVLILIMFAAGNVMYGIYCLFGKLRRGRK